MTTSLLPEGNSTRDGFTWTPESGLKQGVNSVGAIQPSTINVQNPSSLYDVVIIGAGYSGLTAARDCAVAGLRTLLIEARDRIGGRSWSSNIGGYPFEMGGTWVHWHQPNVWREIARYDMRQELESSHDHTFGLNHTHIMGEAHESRLSHDQADAIVKSAMSKFVNVDGADGRTIMPNPHDEFANPQASEYDNLSYADRFAQIENDLSPDEAVALKVLALMSSCATMETSSFYEFLHWWALCHWNYQGFLDYLITYKFRGGQSSFAVRFFEEALKSGELSYSFNTPVASIDQSSSTCVQVVTRAGQVFKAARVICSIPLNVLPHVTFTPSLSDGKLAAAALGNINHCAKVHIETSRTEMRSWVGINFPSNKLNYAIGDGMTPAGNTHIVSFGFTNDHLQPDLDIKGTTMAAITGLGVPEESVKRIVFHNWSRDEFARGAWFFSPPGLVTKHLKDMRATEDRVWFASADWAVGWRSFIDGAIEEGARCAREVKESLKPI